MSDFIGKAVSFVTAFIGISQVDLSKFTPLTVAILVGIIVLCFISGYIASEVSGKFKKQKHDGMGLGNGHG